MDLEIVVWSNILRQDLEKAIQKKMPERLPLATVLTRTKKPYQNCSTPLTISQAGKQMRWLSFYHQNPIIEEDLPAEKRLTFDIGHLAEQYFREALEYTDETEVEYHGLPLRLILRKKPELSIGGELDFVIKNNGYRWLLDMKTMNRTGYLFSTPKYTDEYGIDPETGKYKSYYKLTRARPYSFTFNAYRQWKDDIFTADYLSQIALYTKAYNDRFPEEPIDFSGFLVYCKDSGHHALGYVSKEDLNKITTETIQKLRRVLTSKESKEHPICYPMKDKNTPSIRCVHPPSDWQCPYYQECEAEGLFKLEED